MYVQNFKCATAIGGEPQSSATPQYDVMNFTTTPEENEANVYLTIPDNALSQRNKNAQASSDSATTRAEFAEKLASMTDEDFRRQFKVTNITLLFKRRHRICCLNFQYL